MIVISNAKNVDIPQYDEVWYITNTTPKIVVGAIHRQDLAPMPGIYWKYRRGEITKSELLNLYGNDLWSGKYKEVIDELLTKSREGKWIQLVCYCDDLEKCHRYVLYRYLASLGVTGLSVS